jgi:hypothetical protein
MAKSRIALLRCSNLLGIGFRRGKAVIDKYGNLTHFMLIGKRGKKKKFYAPNGYYMLCYINDFMFRYKELGNDSDEALEEFKRAKKEFKAGHVNF